MDEHMIDDLLDESSNEGLCSMNCSDIQNIINFCKENYDSWKEIKLGYVMTFSSDKKLPLEVNDFELDRGRRNLVFKSKDNISEIVTLSQLEKYLDFLKFDIDDWSSVRISCDNYSYANGSYMNDSNDTYYFLS